MLNNKKHQIWFDRYAAFYKWLQSGFGADAVLHFGMHGTVEWLPGSALGRLIHLETA